MVVGLGQAGYGDRSDDAHVLDADREGTAVRCEQPRFHAACLVQRCPAHREPSSYQVGGCGEPVDDVDLALDPRVVLGRGPRQGGMEQLLAVAPDSYPAHQLLAETYENAEQDEKALAEYKVVAAMAPDLPGVHFSIGHILLQKGQQDQAREELAAELRINPDHPEANAEMGTILLNQMDPAQATPYLEKALQLNPDLWPTYRELGKAYYLQKNFAKAEAALQPAVRHDADGQAHYQLGLVYRSMGQKQEANEQFEISRKLKLAALAHDETKMNTLESLPQ